MGCPIIEGVLYIRNNSINEKPPATPGNTFLPKAKALPHEKGREEAGQQQGRAVFQKSRELLKHDQQSFQVWRLTSRTLGKSLGLVPFVQRKLRAACDG